MSRCEAIPRYARRVLGLTLVLTAILAIAAGTASAQTGSCDDPPAWADACELTLQEAVDRAGKDGLGFVVLPGSSVDGAPVTYDPATVDVEGLTVCAGPAPEAVSVRGPVYVTDEAGHCTYRPDAVIVEGQGVPALALTARKVTVRGLTARVAVDGASVAAVDVTAEEAALRSVVVEVQGGGCTPAEATSDACGDPPTGIGIRFGPGAPGGTVHTSDVVGDIVDPGTSSIGAGTGIRVRAPRVAIVGGTVEGFADAGIDVDAPDADVRPGEVRTNQHGVRLGPAAEDAHVDASFRDNAVGVALSGNGTDPGPESVRLTGNTFLPSTGLAVELGDATEGLFVDAGRNDWGAYECSAVPARIRDVGDGNLVDYLPFDSPAGVEACPTGTADFRAKFDFRGNLDGSQLSFDDGALTVDVTLLDAAGNERRFPATPDGFGPALVTERAGVGADCGSTGDTNAYRNASPAGAVASFEIPAKDLICRSTFPTVWRFKLVSPVGHRIPQAADRLAYSYYDAQLEQVASLVPPLADILDRDGTKVQATADPVAMRVDAPTGAVTRTADEPLGAEVALLDAAGRVASQDNGTTVELSNGTALMSATAESGVATFDDPITEVGVYDQLEATADGLDPELLPNVTVEPGALDHVTFTIDHDETTAGATVTFEAKAFDQHDNLRDDTVTYSKVDGPGTVDATSGEFTSEDTGTATIRAEAVDRQTRDTVNTTTEITVDPAELETIQLACDPTTVEAGSATDCEATPTDRFGNVRPDEVSWEALDGGSVDAAADQTATFHPPTDAGAYTLRATNGTVNATTNVTVVPGPLDHVAFTRAPEETDAVTPVGFAAEPRDAEGNARADDVTYEIASGSGSIDADTGRFVPHETGTTTIRASAGGEAATTTIDVTVGPLADVVFTKAPDRTDADTSVTFVAHPVDAKGNARDDPVSYEVASGGGSIEADGTFHPAAAGNVTIRADAGDRAAQATIAVTPGALADVEFTEAPGKVAAGADATFRARAVDGDGNALDREVAFAVVEGPGRIDENGTFRAEIPGEAEIRAVAGDVDATTTVEVTPGGVAELAIRPQQVTRTAGDTSPVTFEVTAHDAFGNPVDLDPAADVAWSVDDPDAGTFEGAAFDPSDRAGTWTVVATLAADGTVRDRATVVVEPGPVDRIDVAPASLRLAPGDTARLSATALDAFDNARPADLSWSIRDDVATVDATGRVVADSPGRTEIVVRHAPSGASTTVPIAVADEPGRIRSISLQPSSLTLPAGRQQRLRVQATDADGFVDPDARARLRVADPSVASIGSDGLLTANRVGTTTVRAVRGDHNATANVTVVAGSLARIRVSPAAATLSPGDRLELSATGADLRFNPVPLDDVDWSLAGDDVGKLTGNGTFVATDRGDGRIVASARGVETTVPVTVTTLVAPSDATTELQAEAVTDRVGNVTATTWSAGVARARAGSTLDVVTSGGEVERARVDVGEDAERFSIRFTTQPGDLPAAPREVDLVDLSRVASNRTDPAMFVDVGATRDGVDLDSGELNEVVGQVELTFRVPASYFEDLDPADVTLREYSDGRTVGEVPARLLAREPVDGAYRYAVDLDSFSAFAVLGGPGQAAARMDWTLILVVGFAGIFAAVAIATWMRER